MATNPSKCDDCNNALIKKVTYRNDQTGNITPNGIRVVVCMVNDESMSAEVGIEECNKWEAIPE